MIPYTPNKDLSLDLLSRHQQNAAVATVERSGGPASDPDSLFEIATILARGLAGQPVKCGGERARIAEADSESNCRDGQFAIRQ